MTSARMIDYIDYISDYVEEPSLLGMDRLSSHTSGAVKGHIESKLTATGDDKFIPEYLPAKTAFLISPLDMGGISTFKSHYYRMDRSTLDLKIRAVYSAWDEVSNESLFNICQNCGVVGEESIDSIRDRFMTEVVGLVPPQHEELLDYYDSWSSGQIDIEGASRGRGVTIEIPQQLEEGHMHGLYWTNYNHQPFP